MDRGGLLAHVTRARARGVLWQHSDSAALGCDFRDGGRDQRVLAGLMRAGRALCQQWPWDARCWSGWLHRDAPHGACRLLSARHVR